MQTTSNLLAGMEANIDERYSEWLDFIVENYERTHQAFNLACHLHKDQKYGSKPYVYHLKGVARNVLRLAPVVLADVPGNYEKMLLDAVCVAFLHDSMEDVVSTVAELRSMVNEGMTPGYEFGDEVIGPVVNLTRRDNETYSQYVIGRICKCGCSITKLVKLADLRFNKSENLKEIADGRKHFKHMYDKYSFAEHLVMQSIYEG